MDNSINQDQKVESAVSINQYKPSVLFIGNILPVQTLTASNKADPLADSHEIKGFFIKAILGKIKVVSLKF